MLPWRIDDIRRNGLLTILEHAGTDKRVAYHRGNVNEVLLPLLKILVMVLVAAVGLGASMADLTYLWRRPLLLLRSVLAAYIVVSAAVSIPYLRWRRNSANS